MTEYNVCIICNEGKTSNKKLINNPQMIKDLFISIDERIALGQTDLEQVSFRFSSLSASEQENVWYHSDCRKPIVNQINIEHLRKSKLKRSNTLSGTTQGAEQPSSSTESVRPKRIKIIPKSKVCIFSSCNFCKTTISKDLHLVETDNVGEKLLSIKNQTHDECVRICVSDLHEVGDASAQEKYYHRHCMMYAQRTCTLKIGNRSKLLSAICDEELLVSVQNTLNDGDILTMAEVNDAYASIKKQYHGDDIEVKNWKQYLKNLIIDNLPHIEFVTPKRVTESERLVIRKTVTEAVERLSRESKVGTLKNVAYMLREEMMESEYRNWSFKGSFDDFEYPPIVQFFLINLLFGPHELKVAGKRNEEVNKTVEVVSQFLIQNTRSDRQVKHKSKKDSGFKDFIQTPLSTGLPLAIHSKVRDKMIVNNLSEMYIGSDYFKILDLEKRVEQGVLQRMMDSGGICLPDFVKKNVNTWFAIDNIDLLEDTPTGQNTFHGTIIVINQREENGVPLNEPLVIPGKLPQSPLKFKVEYMQEPVIKSTPIRFKECYFEKRESEDYKNFTRIWALATYFTINSRNDRTETDMGTEIDVQLETGGEQNQTEMGASDVSIFEEEPSTKAKMLEKKQVMPTWAATKSLLLSNTHIHLKTNSAVVAPLLKTSPTNYGTLYTALKLAQGISAVIVGPDRKTLITLDMDLYQRALRLQLSEGNTNWILRPGGLHIVFASLHALGKTIDGSGLDICTIESGTYTSAALRGIYNGKAYKRGMEYYITTSLAIMMLMFEKFNLESIQEHCVAFKESLHNRSSDMVKIFSEIESLYTNIVTSLQGTDEGEMAQYLTEILKQIDCRLDFVSACRAGDWIKYLAALEKLIKYFFARNLFHYSRLIPVNLAQMNSLEKDDPTTWEALKEGDFVVAKSEVPFTKLFTDQTLEQLIKELKRHGGIIGLSQDDNALDRLVTISPHLTDFVKQYLHGFPRNWKAGNPNEHYQLSGNVSIRVKANALKLSKSIEKHCGGNPFLVSTPLKNLASSALIPTDIKYDILNYASEGQTRFEEFVQERLVSNSKLSVWDPITKLKLKTFSNYVQKTNVNIGGKVIKLREERQVLGRVLIIQSSRPELVPKLEEIIGDYELSVVPRSLCAVDGSLYLPMDKASLMHSIEAIQSQQPESITSSPSEGQPTRIMIIDAMAVLHCMKTNEMKTINDLKDTFTKKIESMMGSYNEGHVVFDRYLDQSLKNKTRQKRAKKETEFAVHEEMKFNMTLKELLSSSYTKKILTKMFAEDLLKFYSSKENFKFYVIYDNKIKGKDFEEEHAHEEADTLIVHQVQASVYLGSFQHIDVWSPDTDVLIMLLDLAAHELLQRPIQLKFITGKGTKFRVIDVMERVKMIGSPKCQGLIGLHNFSGADWGGKFVGITKKRWANSYMKLSENHPAIKAFQILGNQSIPAELENRELPVQFRALEEFVCNMYSTTGPTTLPLLRWELFRSKNMEGEMLPPTRASLLPHIRRVNFICMRDKSYNRKIPELPPIEENGWIIEKGAYVPVRCLSPPAPNAVIELTKCGCKAGCKDLKCTCFKNGLPCTPLCKCYSFICENMNQIETVDDENE